VYEIDAGKLMRDAQDMAAKFPDINLAPLPRSSVTQRGMFESLLDCEKEPMPLEELQKVKLYMACTPWLSICYSGL